MSPSTRRDFLRLTAGAAASAAAIAVPEPAFGGALNPQSNSPMAASCSGMGAGMGTPRLYLTAGEQRYAMLTAPAWRRYNPRLANAASTITIDPASRHQPVLGFGASLTDAACYVIRQMPEPQREALMQEAFSPQRMNLSVCRICVGSSDYARTAYSFDEGEPDPELKRFSISHDLEYILPVLKQARTINPDLFLLASPWSPPGWMKDNNSMLGGTIRKHLFGAYAEYMTKFLQAYKEAGVEVNAVSIQNEVDTDQDSRMPACLFPQEAEVQYVAEFLGPAIERAGLKTKIWLIDHNYNLWGRAIAELDEPGVAKYTKSIAWHGYLGKPEWIQKVVAAHPDAEMYWTEGGPEITDPAYATDWAKWATTFCGILRNGCRCIIAWNLALDEAGKPNIGPFSCGGTVTVNSQTHEITRSGQYWAFAHVARNFPRGANVVASRGDIAGVEHVAAVLPDGQRSLLLSNSGNGTQKVMIRSEDRVLEVELPAESVATLTWS